MYARWSHHGAEDVPIYAIGPMSHLIRKTHDQSHIANVAAYSACMGYYRAELIERDPRCKGAVALAPRSSEPAIPFTATVVLILTHVCQLF